jgi:GntR family transcriptional regulator
VVLAGLELHAIDGDLLTHPLKAYRDLEREGLVESRPGQGTFVRRTLAGPSLASHAALRRSLARWIHSAYEAGLDGESVLALFMSTFQDAQDRPLSPR